jgi:hypothetical protein
MIDQSNTQEQLVQKKELVTIPSQMFASRVRVTFEFDVTCNSEPIINSDNDEDVQAHDLALLRSFLQTPQFIDMLVDKIVDELCMYAPETFVRRFFPQINTECHQLFGKAIEQLSDENEEYWRDIRDAPKVSYETLLSICTEQILECFKAKFVSSSYEIAESAK